MHEFQTDLAQGQITTLKGQTKWDRAKRRRHRDILWAAKAKPCADCDIQYDPWVMEFDHVDPTYKNFQISRMVGRVSKAALLAEIEKCEIVCANCHRDRTYNRLKDKV